MFPRRIPFNQIAFVTLLGVGGGIYIYKPMFESPRKPTSSLNKQEIKAEVENEGQDGVGRDQITQPATSAANPGATQEAAAAE